MSKFSKILIIVWGCLAILSFVSAFFAPIYFKIIGLIFGGLNMITLITGVVAFFQSIYYKREIEKEFENVQLQTSSQTTKKETSKRGRN